MKIKKPAITVLSIALLAAITLPAGACSTTTNYKPSTLPSLIAFSSDRDYTVHIYTMKPDGTDNRTTSNDPQILDGVPAWSPDGSKIAFISNQADDFDIWTMHEDGSDRIRLTELKGTENWPRWAPDGSRITFVGESWDTEGHKSIEILIMNSDGENIKNLTCNEEHEVQPNAEHTHSHAVRWDSCPTFSPDGKKILFASNRDDATKPILYIMNTDGNDQKKFGWPFEIDGTEADWSPITNKIVFCRGSAAKGEIWVMDGNSPFPLLTAKKITDNSYNNCDPTWSPDGTQIAFVSDTYGSDDIFIMNADGTNVRRLTYEKSNERHPSWR